MTLKEMKQAQNAIRETLSFLSDCSLERHGGNYRFSPCVKDDASKRRLRLVKTFWAYQRMIYKAKGIAL